MDSVESVPQPPSATVTFLFTDIEGSTRLWEDEPEEMRNLVAEHLLGEVAEIVDRMLEASRTISILATSQALLGVRGEHAQLVATLSGPDGVSRDSVELFVERARLTRIDFDLTDDSPCLLARWGLFSSMVGTCRSASWTATPLWL